MVRKIKKIINPKAVFPPVAQNKVKGEIIKGDDLKIDNKNPVKKKMQKNNLDEEGYDIARDMGRVRPSKDKKDATTMPPSKEMKKTQKVNKGPSALELVKKKYKGQIMNVKKEELDLTKVAEAFGGYIVEARKSKGGGAGTGFNNEDEIATSVQNVRRAIKDYEGTQFSSGSFFYNKKYNKKSSDGSNNQQNKNTNERIPVTQNTSVPPDPKKITTGHDTQDFVEPEPEKKKIETKTKTVADRRLQRIRIAAKKTKKPIVKTAKYLKKNPFATLVGASMAKDTFFPVKLPTPPTVQGGKVGRRTAG
jgi:hypothetical protein